MKEFILFILAILLVLLVSPFAIICTIVMLFIRDSREKYNNLSDLFFAMAYSIDMFGNILCSQLFNITLIKHNGYKFGERRETISSVLGKNILTNTLTRTGKVLSNILDFIDTNHCINSIDK